MTKLTRTAFLKHSLPQALLGLGLAIAVGACGGTPTPSPDDTTTPAAGGASGTTTLTVGTEPAFPPFEFQTSDGKDLQGFSVDLIRALAKEMGQEVKFESLPFDGLIPALQTKKLDMVISSMTITAERAKTVDFSNPYFKAGLAIATQADESSLTSLDALQGKKIAVQIGTTGAQEAAKVKDAKISTFDSAPLALQELANGNVDAVINDAPVTLYAIKEGKLDRLKVVGGLLSEEYYGMAFPKGSALNAAVNEALAKLVSNGTYAEIYRKWFNADPPELPTSYQPSA